MNLSGDLLKLIFSAYKTRLSASDFAVTSLLLLTDEKSQENVRQSLENNFFKEKFITSLNTSGKFSVTFDTFPTFAGMLFCFLL